MPKYVEHFVVEGRYPFPVDMLRYDACYPSDAESATNIAASINPEQNHQLPKGETFKVTLTATTPRFVPTEGRWESFMWKVTEINGEPVADYPWRKIA